MSSPPLIPQETHRFFGVPILLDEHGRETRRTILSDDNYERWHQEMETMLKEVCCWDYNLNTIMEPGKGATIFYLGRKVTLLALVFMLVSLDVRERLLATGRMGVCEVWEWLTLTKGQLVALP